jgi:hypothetical protein
MTEKNDLEILMAAIEYGRGIREDVRVTPSTTRVYVMLGVLMGMTIMGVMVLIL